MASSRFAYISGWPFPVICPEALKSRAAAHRSAKFAPLDTPKAKVGNWGESENRLISESRKDLILLISILLFASSVYALFISHRMASSPF